MRYYHKSLKVGSWEGGLKAVLGGESILGRSKVGWCILYIISGLNHSKNDKFLKLERIGAIYEGST
jgi:hypothetical protein